MTNEKPYGIRAIEENKLEAWPNPYAGRPYLISIDIPEFTCLCPRSGYPDFATIKVRYQPRDLIVELKSLKLYINGYRDVPISHEAAVNKILDDLVTLLKPRWMRVTGDFNVRGNIKTIVRAEYGVREKVGEPSCSEDDTSVDQNEGSGEHYLLLSGGVDSSTLAGWLCERYGPSRVHAVTFLYGQKHAVEVEAAEAVAAHYRLATHEVVELPPIRGSALTDVHVPLPVGRDLSEAHGIAPSYVPARNLLLLSFLASIADARGPATLWIGVHHDDHTGYPDCRPEFVEAADRAVRLGTQYGLRVQAPFVRWRKEEIIRWGLEHGVPYELTYSCYQGLDPACGVCDTCQARRAAFAAAGAVDPRPYADGGALGMAGTKSDSN